MGMVDNKSFSSAAEQLANAAAVRERLLNPKRFSPTDAEALKARAKKLEAEIDSHKLTIQQQAERIERMKLDMADLHGAILSQAHMLIDTFRSSSGETERTIRRSPRQIIESVLERDFPGITFSDVVSPRRHRDLVEPRHRCMAAVYTERKDLSVPQLGKIFDRDHTTILAAMRKLGATRGQS